MKHRIDQGNSVYIFIQRERIGIVYVLTLRNKGNKTYASYIMARKLTLGNREIPLNMDVDCAPSFQLAVLTDVVF